MLKKLTIEALHAAIDAGDSRMLAGFACPDDGGDIANPEECEHSVCDRGDAWCAALKAKPQEPQAQRSSSIAPLVAAAEQLGPRALALLQSIADRLVKGAKEHGDFAEPKELRREALEEHLDAVVYLALELQQGAEGKHDDRDE